MNGFKYWSIVYAYLAATTVFTLTTYCYMPYRLKFAIDLGIAKQYLRFGMPVFLTGLLSFAIFNMDNFVVGAVAGASQLGYYAISFNWGSMVCSIMGAVVFGVLFPTFSRMQGDPERMKQAYLRILQYTALLSFLCNVGLFCVADNFLISVLGKGSDKWLPCLATMRILCFYGVVRSLTEPASSLLMAQGTARIPLKAALLTAVIELALVYPAIRFGSIATVGWAVLVAYCSQLVVYLPALKRMNGITISEIGAKVLPAAAAGAVMIGCFLLFQGYLPAGPVKLTVSIVTLTAIYLTIYGIITQFKAYDELKGLFLGR
jgi:O-antigen/teichoic acid export membrane protein